MTPSSRSRTHQNQALNRQQSPLSLPLPHRYATGERSKKRRLIGPIETGGSRHRHGKCRPSGPEESHFHLWVQTKSDIQRRFRTGGTPVQRSKVKCRPFGPEEISGEILSQQKTGGLPATPAPEGRHNVCRGREAPGWRALRLPSYFNGLHQPHGPRRRRESLACASLSVRLVDLDA